MRANAADMLVQKTRGVIGAVTLGLGLICIALAVPTQGTAQGVRGERETVASDRFDMATDLPDPLDLQMSQVETLRKASPIYVARDWSYVWWGALAGGIAGGVYGAVAMAGVDAYMGPPLYFLTAPAGAVVGAAVGTGLVFLLGDE